MSSHVMRVSPAHQITNLRDPEIHWGDGRRKSTTDSGIKKTVLVFQGQLYQLRRKHLSPNQIHCHGYMI